jgi:stage III sporulation protein AA
MYTYEKTRHKPIKVWSEKAEGGRERYKPVLDSVPITIRSIINRLSPEVLDGIEEFRLKAGAPFIIYGAGDSAYITGDGRISKDKAKAYIVTPDDTAKALQLMCDCSIYSIEDELRNGYITIRGGHRIGVVGKVVTEGSRVKTIKDISGLNIRISRQVTGCSSSLLPSLIRGRDSVYNTLIVSPPQCGKTTLLRDIIRQISDGIPALGFNGIKVGLVDERSELAGCYKGIPQNDMGIRTDILDACPKAQGMMMLIRSMSPRVIATDELGRPEDLVSIQEAINAGVNIITTVHGWSTKDIQNKPVIGKLMQDGVFERIVVLSRRKGPGTIEEVVNVSGGKKNSEFGGTRYDC